MDKTKQTQRLYYEDSYLWKFTAEIIERTERKGHPVVVLDRTCFYPESGGQPPDQGNINGILVTDVQEEDGRILHFLAGRIEDNRVTGYVDGKVRLDHMQQHTGQHILSQCFVEILDAGTLAFHLGKEYSTLEMNLNEISDDEWDRVEQRANEIIRENRTIRIRLGSERMAEELPLRRPPQKSGDLRIIEIADFDFSACCGTHCRTTGEVGIIKIMRWEKIRGNLRFEFLCGERAFKDYNYKHRIVRDLSVMLTVGDEDLPRAVDKLREESREAKKEVRRLQTRLMEIDAERMIDGAEGGILKKILPEGSPEDLRQLASTLIKNPGIFVLLGLKTPERAFMVMGRSDDMDLDMREVLAAASQYIEGRGGGQPSLVQMAGARVDGLEKALAAAEKYVISRK